MTAAPVRALRSEADDTIAARAAALDPAHIGAALDGDGHAVLKGVLDAETCAALRGLYDEDTRFRRRVVMARHGFGRGEYKYFADPVPAVVSTLRCALYPRLAGIANNWQGRLRSDLRYPAEFEAFRARCHRAGQTQPTPLLLRYGAGDYNCLHRDLYGEHVFPLQATILLTPASAFTGGAFVLVEQVPRRQSRASVVTLGLGDAVIFPVRERPEAGTRGFHRVLVRHGVSRIDSGERMTLGLIFHDAQ